MIKVENHKLTIKGIKLLGSVCLMVLMLAQIAYAAEASVKTATMKATYRHPITGSIEDAGGESGEAIGQGMVENVVESMGLVETDEAGNIYLTMRFQMTDSISKLSFQVQKADASAFSNTQSEKIKEDASNHTVDYRILMPATDGIIKVSAYVEPMGRSVVFFLQPTNLTEGNQTDFTVMQKAEQSSASANQILADETGLTVSDHATSEVEEQNADTGAATENIALATDESVSQTVAALLAENAANQSVQAQNISMEDSEYVVMEDSAFLQVNRQFWLCLFLEMVAAMVLSGLILMGIQALFKKFFYEKKAYHWDKGTDVEQEVYEDEEM